MGRRRRCFLGLMGLVVATALAPAAGCGNRYSLGGGPPAPTTADASPTPTESTPATSPTITPFSIPVPTGNAGGLAFDGTFVWATTYPSPTSSDIAHILKLDPVTGAVLFESGDFSWNARGITAGNGHLWITDALGDRVREIDPGAGFAEVSSFSTPGSEPTGIGFHGGDLWLLDPNAQTVYRLSTSGSQLGSFGLGTNQYHLALEWDEMGMWSNTSPMVLTHYTPSWVQEESKTLAFATGDIAIAGDRVFIAAGTTIEVTAWPLP